MEVLHEIYGLAVGSTRYRNKLQQRLQDYFESNISFFLCTNKKIAEVYCLLLKLIVDQQSQVRATVKLFERRYTK